MTPTEQAVTEAIKWGVPAGLAGIAGWLALRRARLVAWRRRRRDTQRALEAMAEGFPSLVMRLGEAHDLGAEVREGLSELNAGMADVLALVYGMFEMSAGPQFVCDSTGRNVMVNTAYAQMLRAGRDDLMDYRYKRFLAGPDIKAYMDRFLEASAEHREFEDEIHFCCADGTLFKARVRMVPHPRLKGPATHWFGTVTALEASC